MTGPRCDAATTIDAYAHGADAYDDVWSPVILPPALRVIEGLDLRDAARVADVGAGTGALTAALREATSPDALIASVDRSAEMLRYAQERRGVTATLADAAALPVQTGTVDAVLFAYVLFMLLDPATGLAEAMRLLRPGGRIGTVTWASEQATHAALVWDETLAEFGAAPPPAHSNHQGLATEDAVDRLLRGVGLRPCKVWRETVEHMFEPASFWRLRTSHGTNRLRLFALDRATRARAERELRRRLGALPPHAYGFRGTLVCSVSEKPIPDPAPE
jgi:ubiquinone/menaquinone biosynthesis C-methylase UbiE